MAKTALDLVVTAQDKASAVLSKVASAVNAASGIRGHSGKFAQGSDPVIGGTIRLALALNAIRGALDLTAVAFKWFRGDVDGVNEVMKRLPLGIGALYRSVDTFMSEITGRAAELERFEKNFKRVFSIMDSQSAALIEKINQRSQMIGPAVALAQQQADTRKLYEAALLGQFAEDRERANQVYEKTMLDISKKMQDLDALGLNPNAPQAQTIKRQLEDARRDAWEILTLQLDSIRLKRDLDIQNDKTILAAELASIEEKARDDRERARDLFDRTLEQLAEQAKRKNQEEARIYRLANVTDQQRLTGLRQAAIESGIVNQQVTYSKQTADTLVKILSVSQEFLRRLGYQGVMPGVFE